MNSHSNIWLNEYEGLVPIPASDREPEAGPQSPTHSQYEAVSPHFELTPVHLEKTNRVAFFE